VKKNLPVTQREIDYPEDKVFVTRTDTKGIITYANDSFVEVSGFSREELLGINHNLVRHPDMPEWAFKSLWDTLKSGHPWIGIVKNRAANGDHYWVRATVSPVTNNGIVTEYISLRKNRHAPKYRLRRRCISLVKRPRRNPAIQAVSEPHPANQAATFNPAGSVADAGCRQSCHR